jgi:uncharacterized protein YkwD
MWTLSSSTTILAAFLMSGNRRILSVMVILLGVSLSIGARADADSAVPSATGATLGPGELTVVQLINTFRAQNGRPALRVGPALSRAAQAHSNDMARRDYFDHGDFVTRLRSFGVRAPYIGENLAAGTRPLTPAAIVRMWIKSPPHRENLLDRDFRRIGVGMAGGSMRLVTADFSGR